MRNSRNRSLIRKSRPHSKQKYSDSASYIQKYYRRYIDSRYMGLCRNFDDDDIFTLTPVSIIPRSLLIVVDNHGFNACNLLTWICKSGKHPITREPIGDNVVSECVNHIQFFLSVECIKKSSKGSFCQKRKAYYKSLQLSNIIIDDNNE